MSRTGKSRDRSTPSYAKMGRVEMQKLHEKANREFLNELGLPLNNERPSKALRRLSRGHLQVPQD